LNPPSGVETRSPVMRRVGAEALMSQTLRTQGRL
jgi:hypothetical protein